MKKVAIVGAGPAGLVCARYLKSAGLEPVLFEQGSAIGGQWSGDARYSGVWPSMCTSTSRIMTAFSDLPHASGTAVFPSNQSVGAYLRRYAETFDLVRHVRLNTAVDAIGRDGDRWHIGAEVFDRVVVASGRYRKPNLPTIPGLETFPGEAIHAFHYKRPESYRGKRVLVIGCGISSLEIASDLAMLGAARVLSSNRRQRYVLSKLIGGVPMEQVTFTRFAAMAERGVSRDAAARRFKEFVLRTSGSPDQYGAPKPGENVFDAGATISQHYLPLVAEGRIVPKPWIDSIEESRVRFTDGSTEDVDAIVFGTGYELQLPFLGDDVQRILGLDTAHLDLYRFTFHPELPGMAFLGLFGLKGAYFPVLELQARWVAYAWSGVRPMPARADMEAELAVQRRLARQYFPMHAIAALFAREAGIEPDVEQWPELAGALLFGPLTPMSYRLNGPDRSGEAPRRVAEEAVMFGAVTTPELTDEQRGRLESVRLAVR